MNVRPRQTTLNVIDVQKPYQNQNMTHTLLKKLVIVSAAPSNLLTLCILMDSSSWFDAINLV